MKYNCKSRERIAYIILLPKIQVNKQSYTRNKNVICFYEGLSGAMNTSTAKLLCAINGSGIS